ncbi:hypothetical protein GLOIN_2v1785173 [Rhizophagus irregularis DAOM 181602=DAOM 197198]|nr:hypothetical protein GLOIN_2v1785173 [Rhizophagus irregularis DAOM 181602=DAOM 197198]
MDDSTLIASSKSRIEDRLSITAEFYTLNNVQANSAKYVFVLFNQLSSLCFQYFEEKAGLATTTPLPLLFLKLPFSIQNAFYRFLSSHIASWQKIFTHPDFKDFALYAISYLQGYLGAESCPTTINLEPCWKLWKNLNIFVLAQLVSPCVRYLMNWPDLRYLGIVGRKGRIPNWFTFINNNFLSSFSSTLLLPSYFINSSLTLASPCLLDHTVKDYSFYPQWAINF